MDCFENLIHLIITCFLLAICPPFQNHFLWCAQAHEGFIILFILSGVIPIRQKFYARLRLYLYFSKCKYIIFDISSYFQCHTINVYNSKIQVKNDFTYQVQIWKEDKSRL